MTPEEIITSIISAIIAYLVPSILKKAEKDLVQGASTPAVGWSLAGFFGGAIGGAASALIGIIDLGFEGFGNWAVFGASLGLTQWFILRSYRPINAWYPIATTLGWILFNFGGPLAGWLVAGFFVGLFQFFSLRTLTGAGWWIPANFVAWPIGGAIGFIAGTILTPISFELAWIIGWGIVGLVGNIILIAPLARLKST